jgi:ABC-type bacteriocin/lantibiotic exporter with double-glycine peptidase domain
MQHIRQTSRTNCGQTCAAMIATLTRKCLILPSTIEEIVGTRGRTRYTHIRKAMKHYGVSCDPVKRPTIKEWLPWGETMILRVAYSRKPHRSHWVVIDAKGEVYDPSYHAPTSFSVWKARQLDVAGGWIASFMVVR